MNLLFLKNYRPFNGFIVIKKLECLLFGEIRRVIVLLFYYVGVDGNVVVSNKFNLVYEELKRNGMVYSFSDKAAYQLLSFGYMVDDSTFFKRGEEGESWKVFVCE